MLLSIAFNVALLFICAYLWRSGGRTGRWGVLIVLAATVLTVIAGFVGAKFDKIEPLLFAADALVLCGMVALAIFSRRRWPIWASAMQLNCVAGHIVAAIAPVTVAKVYYAMETAWALPVLLAMVGGTALDRRFNRRMALAAGGVLSGDLDRLHDTHSGR